MGLGLGVLTLALTKLEFQSWFFHVICVICVNFLTSLRLSFLIWTGNSNPTLQGHP